MSAVARQFGTGSRAVRTALITLAAGGTTFLITDGLDQPLDASIMLSVLIGGIVLVVRFLVEFEKRLAAVEKLEKDGMIAMKKLVGDAFTEISDATELHGMIEASALDTGLVTQLVRHSSAISVETPPIVRRLAQEKVRETSEFLKQLNDGGTVTYIGEDRDWLLGLTRNAAESVDAISLAAVDHDLWSSEIGQRYLDAQRRAAQAGRRVRRIFVLDHPAMEHDPVIRRTYEEQLRLSIGVRLLDRAAVPTHLKVELRDLIVFDEILAYETLPTVNDPQFAQVAETRLVLNDARVKEYNQLFRELWDVSRELAEEPVPDGQRKA